MTPDEIKAREAVRTALTGFDLHMQAGVPSHVYLGPYEAGQVAHVAVDAFLAVLSPLPDEQLDEIEAHVTSGIASDSDGAELAVSSIPALIAEVRRLRSALAAAEENVAALIIGGAPHPAEETEWGAGYEADPGDGNGPRWYGMDASGYTIREAAEREVERYSDSQIRLVRRRKAGPWEPVPEGSAR